MAALSESCKDPDYLMKVIGGFLRQEDGEIERPKRNKLTIGIESASLAILSSLESSKIPDTEVLFNDNDPEFIDKSQFPAPRFFWPKMFLFTPEKSASPVPLSWGGVRHGDANLLR